MLLGSTPPTPAQLDALTAYHTRHGGQALVVRHRGKVVHEHYAAGRKAETASELASGTKSFAGVVAIAAQEDGLLKLDEKVADTITEWKGDSRKSEITIRQLLNLSSGLRGGGTGSPMPYAEAIKIDTFAAPGKAFQYGPAPFQVFGELIKRKLKKETYLEYLRRRILDPIGCDIGAWRVRWGDPVMPSGASFTAREWAVFGELIRLEGKWDDKQILKAASIQQLWRPGASPRYGLTWWLGGETRQSVPGMVMAAGMGKQRLYVLKEHDLVIARLAPVAGREGRGWDDAEFLNKLKVK